MAYVSWNRLVSSDRRRAVSDPEEDTAREDAKALIAEQYAMERELWQIHAQLCADPACGELVDRYRECHYRYVVFLRNLSRLYYQEMGLGLPGEVR